MVSPSEHFFGPGPGFLVAWPASLAAAALPLPCAAPPLDSRLALAADVSPTRSSPLAHVHSILLHNSHLEQHMELCCLWRVASCINVE